MSKPETPVMRMIVLFPAFARQIFPWNARVIGLLAGPKIGYRQGLLASSAGKLAIGLSADLFVTPCSFSEIENPAELSVRSVLAGEDVESCANRPDETKHGVSNWID